MEYTSSLLDQADLQLEPGSFRDRTGRIFYENGQVFRCLSAEAARHWDVLRQKRFFNEALAQGRLIPTSAAEFGLTGRLPEGEWAAVLRHERVPFISYPYEWSFGMLKDAALLHLDLLFQALEEGMTLKDSSAFNVQWRGAAPVFIDIPSFESTMPGEPWVGYRQFCQMFLYPLMLQAYKGVSFRPWLRGNIDGIAPEEMSGLMSWGDFLRPGVFSHVMLHSRLQASHADTATHVKSTIRDAGFSSELVKANVRKLRALVQGLSLPHKSTEWGDYVKQHNYTDADLSAKADFVREAVLRRPLGRVWDLGANTGTFSRIAAENAETVIAMDFDHLAIERLYQSLKRENNRRILPLVMNVADPSPSLGWLGLERKNLADRGAPDLTLCLALIHHLVISANIQVADFIRWLASLNTGVVIEFVTKDDPMVKKLLRNKIDNYADYEPDAFERCLSAFFSIRRREMLQSGTRILYDAEPFR